MRPNVACTYLVYTFPTDLNVIHESAEWQGRAQYHVFALRSRYNPVHKAAQVMIALPWSRTGMSPLSGLLEAQQVDKSCLSSNSVRKSSMIFSADMRRLNSAWYSSSAL